LYEELELAEVVEVGDESVGEEASEGGVEYELEWRLC
jgi:hypothetical protein